MTRNAASAAAKKPSPSRKTADQSCAKPAQLANEEAAPVASHVHVLQDLLAQRLLDAAPGAKWSARASIAFVVLICGGFWLSVFVIVRLLLPLR